jgi:hypothetical protein
MKQNNKYRILYRGDVITIAGEDYIYDSGTGKLRNIRNLRQLLDPAEIQKTVIQLPNTRWSI